MKFNQEMKRMVKNVAWGLLTLCAVIGTSCSDDDNGELPFILVIM